jgi:hypothetical protein
VELFFFEKKNCTFGRLVFYFVLHFPTFQLFIFYFFSILVTNEQYGPVFTICVLAFPDAMLGGVMFFFCLRSCSGVFQSFTIITEVYELLCVFLYFILRHILSN